MTLKVCDHEIGNFSIEHYDHLETEFVYLSFTDLELVEKLRSADGCINNFCPKCGEKLEGLLTLRENEIKQTHIKEEKRKKRETLKKKKAFLAEAKDLAIKTGIDKLPDEGEFIVLFYSITDYDTRDILFRGTKEDIAKSCVSYTFNQIPKRDQLKIKAIYETPSFNEFARAIKAFGFSLREATGESFVRKSENYDEIVSYEKGIVYLCRESLDEDGYKKATYDHFAINNISEALGVKIELREVKLT